MAPALFYLLLLAVLAYQLQRRVVLLEPFRGPPRYLLSFGLTLFLAAWANFAIYAAFGWGFIRAWGSWLVVLTPVAAFAFRDWIRVAPGPASPASPGPVSGTAGWSFRRGDLWFAFLTAFILMRFCLNLTFDDVGQVWCNFSFFDTPFHLSVMNAFLQSPRFPPTDLDMPPFPLKYHFMADFHLAHLVRLGLPALKALWLMNVLSGLAMVGAVWAAFERWLGLPARWTLLACLVFLFLNLSLINLVHYFAYHPPYYHVERPFYQLMGFQYLNFEALLANCLEPQRALLFSLPVIVLILQALFGPAASSPEDGEESPRHRQRVQWVFVLICLLPFAHIVAFAVLALAAIPAVWRHRAWFVRHPGHWLPVFVVGVLQLVYLRSYGPPTNPAYSGWDARNFIPLQEYTNVPAYLRRAVFWFFANGDFLGWGLVFAGSVLLRRRGAAADSGADLRSFLRRWRWYLAVCLGCFALINVYRYSFAWGDSNKFVVFLNFALAGIIVLGAAQWRNRPRPRLSHAFWWFFFLLCVLPPSYNFYRRILATDHDMVLLFTPNELAAANWLKTVAGPQDVTLTSPDDQIHFVSSLAGRPVRAGIYGGSNPYLRPGLIETIRRVYEDGDLSLLPQLETRFVCISSAERSRYHLNRRWHQLMDQGIGLAFHAGRSDAEDGTSIFMFDSQYLSTLPPETFK
jgi:hypothetical protein